jgi:hypothetical protein
MQMKARRACVLAASIAGVACARFEYDDPGCQPVPEEPTHSTVAWQRSGRHGHITGRILSLPDGKPLPEAQARLQNGRIHVDDANGAIDIDGVTVGRDTLFVGMIGHAMVFALLDVRPDSGISFIAVMEPRPPVLIRDFCDLARHRKPWWRVW